MDSPLAAASGRARPTTWPPSCDCTRSATWCGTTRAATSTAGGSPTSPGLEHGEHATLVAQVEKAALREMRQRQRQDAAGRHARREGRASSTARSSTPHKLRADQARRAGGVRRQGRRVQPQAAAHPPAVRAARRGRRGPPVPVRLPGHREAQLAGRSRNCVRQVLDVLDDPTDPLPPSLRKARGAAPSSAGRCGGSTCRRAEADNHAARHRLVWDEAMGVQLALALRRQATVSRPAAGVPAEAGRAAGRRSTPGCRSR